MHLNLLAFNNDTNLCARPELLEESTKTFFSLATVRYGCGVGIFSGVPGNVHPVLCTLPPILFPLLPRAVLTLNTKQISLYKKTRKTQRADAVV